MSRIAQIDVWDARFSFRDGPYAMSHVVQETTRGRHVRIALDDGGIGLGEIAYPPSLPEGDIDAAIADEPSVFGALAGETLDAALIRSHRLADGAKADRAVAFGIETAVLDAQARSEDRPLYDLLGGTRTESVPDYFSISEATPERVVERMAQCGLDRAVIQLKLGVGDRAADAALLRAALGAMAQHQIMLADANGGWTADDMVRMADVFRDRRIVWEEPTGDYDSNAIIARKVAADGGATIMVDQCVADPATARRAIVDGVVGSLCIKPAFCGGLSAGRSIRDAAAEAGLAMRIDGPWCGDIATAAILHLAVGAPPDLLIAGCDLREPLVLTPDFGGAVAVAGGRVAPPRGAGLGIADIAPRLGPPAARYA